MSKRGISLVGACLLLITISLKAEVQVILLPTTLNQKVVGDINTRIDGEHLVSMELASLKTTLAQYLPEDRASRLKINADGFVDVKSLADAGVVAAFNYQDMSLTLTIPAENVRTQSVTIMGNPPLTHGKIAVPSDFSAYMNLRGAVDYLETTHGQSGFTDPQLAIENVFNERGVVLYNETDINSEPDKAWEKRDTRLIWDQPYDRVRWVLGDLAYPVTGFQIAFPMAGLSLQREQSLQPYRIYTPMGQSSFFLKDSSKVEVLVNGQPVQTLQLEAGPHQINNFPLTGGANNVVLRITDPVGRVEYIDTRFFYYSGLLKSGESAFNFAFGFPSIAQAQSPFYHYDTEPAASAYYRRGFTDTFTAGVNAQATFDTQQGGAEAILATRAGIVGFDSALTENNVLGMGLAQRIQYQYYAPHESYARNGTLNASVQHQDSKFVPPNPFSIPVSHEEAWNFQSSYFQSLTENFGAGAGYNYQLRSQHEDQQTYSLSLSHHWRRISTSVTLQRNIGQENSWSGFVSISINLGNGHGIYTSYDSRTETGRGEELYTYDGNGRNITTMVGTQDSPDQNEFYGNLQYYGQRSDFAIGQDAFLKGDMRTSLRWGTALAYVDGELAVTHPIRDSFAIIDSTASLHSEGGIGVRPQGGTDGFSSRESIFGPAVMPDLIGYNYAYTAVQSRKPEADFDPQEGDMCFMPTYRSGTHVRVGPSAVASRVTAKLLWSDGKVAALQAGTIAMPGDASVEFFSNRDGVIYLDGLQPGTYSASLASHPEAAFSINIPAKAGAESDLGEIRVPAKE